MNLLVTGAQGLIGRHLVDELSTAHQVWAVGRSTASAARARHILADLASPDFAGQLPAGIDTVVHLAQSQHYAAFPDQALDIFQVNVASTAALLDWSRRTGVRRFILASAGGANDGADGPLSYYLGTKRSAEILAAAYHSHFSVIILRFHFVYGKGQQRSKLVPRLVDAVKDGRAITLHGANGIRVVPTHVDDAVRAIVAAAGVDGTHTLDVAGPAPLTIREMGESIARHLGREPRFDVVPAGAARDVIANTTAMDALLGPSRRAFSDGVVDVLA